MSPYRTLPPQQLEVHRLWFPKPGDVVRIVPGRIYAPREVGRLGLVLELLTETTPANRPRATEAMYLVHLSPDRRQGVRRLEPPTTGVFFLDELEQVPWPEGAAFAESV